MKIYLKHTSVPSQKSAQDIINEIASRNATQIRQEYKDGVLIGLAFLISLPDGRTLPVELPARTVAMKELLYRQLGPRQKNTRTPEDMADDAARIVWRQLSYWVKAQMALVDLELVRLEEVFMPYILVVPGKTLFTVMADQGFNMKALKGKE